MQKVSICLEKLGENTRSLRILGKSAEIQIGCLTNMQVYSVSSTPFCYLDVRLGLQDSTWHKSDVLQRFRLMSMTRPISYSVRHNHCCHLDALWNELAISRWLVKPVRGSVGCVYESVVNELLRKKVNETALLMKRVLSRLTTRYNQWQLKTLRLDKDHGSGICFRVNHTYKARPIPYLYSVGRKCHADATLPMWYSKSNLLNCFLYLPVE